MNNKFLGLALACVFASSTAYATEAYKLELMHLNDLHSYLAPSQISFATPSGKIAVEVGGASALASVIEAKRAKNPQLLLISAGDQITGNVANYDSFKGEADAVVHGVLKTDFYTLGNHEFDYGTKGIVTYARFMQQFAPKAQLVISNVTASAESELLPFINTSVVKNVGGRDIGVLAITNPEKIYKSSSPDSDTEITDSVEAVNLHAKSLKTDIKILITHEGVALDRINAAKLEDIDVIIGGDSHSLCGSFKGSGLKADCLYPMTLKNAQGKKLCLVQAYEHAKLVGDLEVSFDENGNVLSCVGKPVMPIWTNTASFKQSKHGTKEQAKAELEKLIAQKEEFVEAVPNAQMDAALKPYLAKIEKLYSQTIGIAKENLCSTRLPGGFCGIKNKPSSTGSETCQVLGKIYLNEFGGDFYLANAGGVRMDLPKGDISLDTISKIIPFGNELVLVDISGADLTELLNQISRYIIREPASHSGSMPCGINLTFNVNMKASDPIFDLRIINNGVPEPIVASRIYKMVTNDYLAKGKDGYHLLSKKPVAYTHTKEVNAVVDYLKKFQYLPKLSEEHLMVQKIIK